MSKRSGTSLTRLGDDRLVPLHKAILEFFPELVDVAKLESSMKAARKRCLNGSHSHRWVKYNYMRSQALKRFQQLEGVTPQARHEAAIRQFHIAEERCRASNAKLYGCLDSSALMEPHHVASLKRARRVFMELFGDLEYEEVFFNLAFSQGATTEFPRKAADSSHKWAMGAHVTNGAVFLLNAYLEWARLPLDHIVRPKMCDAAIFFSVLKNWQRNRGCEKQATWNVALQKGIGGAMRHRLQRRAGLLTPDAQEKHSALAKEGSITGLLTTGDLDTASDSVSVALVHTVASGSRCYRLLAGTRHEYVEIDGKATLVEKFSSMGNGYTFELETAVFYCLLRAVCGKDAVISVYGDDLIYPTRNHDAVVELFEACGLMFNHEKTFSGDSKFRESCGGHFYNGRCVKPFYIESLPKTYGQVIELHNGIMRWCEGMPPLPGLLNIMRCCRRLIPRAFWGPYGLPGAIWAEWDEAVPRFRRRGGTVKVPIYASCLTDRSLKRVGYQLEKGPYYQRWEVSVVRYSVPTQVHDYYIGSLLKGLSRVNAPRADVARVPRMWTRPCTRDVVKLMDVELAKFAFPESKVEVIGRASVGVAQHWSRLPVRV